jgi:hypothetical protein
MTVLVLSLSVPVISGVAVSSELVVDLKSLLPNILGYIISFVILGGPSQFVLLRKEDRPPALMAEHTLPTLHRFHPIFHGPNRQVSTATNSFDNIWREPDSDWDLSSHHMVVLHPEPSACRKESEPSRC